MACDQLFKTIEELTDIYLSVWEDVCNIESPTDCKAGVDAVGQYFIRMARARGWQVETLKQPVAGDAVCITLNAQAQARAVSFSGHMDTVHPVGSFGSPAVRRDTDKIYGPGVVDCKGGIVAAFLAMDALDRCGFRARPVQLLLQSDEECSSAISQKKTIGYICEKAKASAAFFNMEGQTPGEACLLRKGILNYLFCITGQEAHASKCAELGANAIAEAAHKILEIEKIKDAEGVTCCCSVIEGGTVPNTVPGKCTFQVNVRFATSNQEVWIANELKRIADTVYIPGCSCSLTQLTHRVAMEYSEKNEALLATMNRIFSANGLTTLKASKRTGGSDAAYVTAAGIPCVDSVGVAGGKIHSPEEYALLASLPELAKRLAAVAYCIE